MDRAQRERNESWEPGRREQARDWRWRPDAYVNWDDEAENYDSFVMCELADTAAYLDLADIRPTDSVLDVCCGPGRFTMLAAERAASVTAIDSSAKMLSHAISGASARGFGNISFQQIDWDCVLPGQNIAKHDVVLAARCPAMYDIEKLCALARRTVMLQIFADAPSIPALQGVLFSGCKDAEGKGMPTPGGHGHGFPGGSHRGKGRNRRPSSAYFELFSKVYDAGYNPNVRIMPERFRKKFATREDAVAWVCSLRPALSAGNEERVAANAAPFITQVEGGFEFCISTTAAIIWWDVER